jgi:hypothetical protein
MRCYQYKLHIIILFSILFGFVAFSFASDKGVRELDRKTREKIEEAVIGQQIRIMPQFNKLNFGFGRFDGIDYYFTKTISRIFFQDLQINVKVDDVEFEDHTVTLELSHPIFGYGDIDFVFSKELLKRAAEADIEKIMLNSLGNENHLYVFSNPGGKIVHLYTCNHLQDPDKSVRMTLEHAEKKRYKKCGFCFKKMLYLPELSMERTIERAWTQRLSEYQTMMEGTDRQIELQKIGEEILNKWPFPLLGFEYTFYLVNSQDINAFAIPTGKIVVTTGILDSLENDEELEALLVFAIAHVEKRHSLKQYRARLARLEKSQQVISLASAAGSIASAVAGGLWGAISVVPLGEETDLPKPILGFQEIYESEATIIAALYFDIHQKNKNNLGALIRKLQFNEMTELFHPDLKDYKIIDLEERINSIKKTEFLYFGKEKRFKTERQDKAPYELDLLYQYIRADKNALDVYITDKRLLKRFGGGMEKQKASLLISDKSGQQEFVLDKRFTTEDAWGIFLTFFADTDQKQRFLQNIETIVLKIGTPRSPNDRKQEGGLELFTFVEGKLDYDD